MTRTGWFRHRSLLAVELLLAALLPAAVAVVDGASGGTVPTEDAQVTVMTRNLFLGTGLDDVFAASSWSELVAAGSTAWARLLASDVPTRAEALADEVAQAGPDVLGLQEVTLWRDETPSDVQEQPTPNATHVAFDFLALLQRALSARGTPYTAVTTSANADLEFPRRDASGGLVDLRVTDRDVLLVRTDLAEQAGNPATGYYTAQFSESFLTGQVTSLRAWTAIDYRPDPATTVRIVNTHLEVGGPAQEQQADEFVSLVAASPHPVIALGDFNIPA